MKEKILSHLNNPQQLEKLYREDKLAFKKTYNALYPEIKNNPIADCWHTRLNYEKEENARGSNQDLIVVIVASLLAGFLAKIPTFLSLDEEFFYLRNIGFIVFPLLTAYFAWKNKLSVKATAVIGGILLASVVFINVLPAVRQTDTLVLSCIHLLLFLWSILGFAYVGSGLKNDKKRLGFLKYNGDLVVMTTLILLAGGIMTGLTIGLFSLIGFEIAQFYFDHVAIFGLAASPIIGTYLVQTNPELVGRVSPVIARIFSPLVLITLIVYLGAIIFTGKDPYNNREFLLIFNALLIGVMAIIFFSVAESTKAPQNRIGILILFLLSATTVLLNGIALSAILFRISEWGITPNRAAVLGGNICILLNLLFVTTKLYRVATKKAEIPEVGQAITFFLPVYCLWTVVVTFFFPFLFGFK